MPASGNELMKSIGRVTASFGVAGHLDGDTFEAVTQKADMAMYAAKQAGRNRVVCAGGQLTAGVAPVVDR